MQNIFILVYFITWHGGHFEKGIEKLFCNRNIIIILKEIFNSTFISDDPLNI